MEQIKEAAKEKFSETEIDDFINMGTKLTSKAVLSAALEVLRTSTHADAPRLIERFTRLIPQAAGVIIVDLNGLDMKLNIALSICPRDYIADIMVPDDPSFKKDLYSQYDLLKNLAMAYWKQFTEDNAGLITQMKECCPTANFDELTVGIGDANTTLFFDDACEKRAGVFPYYTDKNGLPYVKKGCGGAGKQGIPKPNGAKGKFKGKK